MTDLFSVCIRFNGGNPQWFTVRYINFTLKGVKDQLNEINQGLNPGDTRSVEYVWYEHPTFDEGRITFSQPELTNNDDVRNMFLIFCQHNMFPWIDVFVTLLRSPEDILKSLIMPEP
ncbi:40S ribosomal S10-like protein [Medicago truncatula]|uniref:40S ribosomal S10-like protein n=1 Tax=Medicago truncatula TaxID=3880 RepID=A0A072VGW4_MEDTR|nr:40S ribosomal S10-like protein [Medicago truncatula]